MASATPQNPVEYYVLKQGEMFGPFGKEDLRAGLADGRFEKRDFVQMEGRVAWQPLEWILGAHEVDVEGAVAPDWACILKWAWLRLRYNLGEQSVLAGSVCLIAGTLSIALSHWPFVFWVPWFLAAAVAGISLVRRKNEAHGAALLAAVICVPVLFLIFGPKASSAKAERLAQNASKANFPAPAPAAMPTPAPAAAPIPGISASTPATPPPVVISATPTPLPVVSAPVSTPPPTPVRTARSFAFAATPAPTPEPAPSTPETNSFLSAAGKLAGAVMPFIVGTKPSPATPPPDLLQSHQDAFVIMRGTNGSGSGFVCRVDGKTWLFTNIHVVSEIKQPAITRLDGTPITAGLGDVAAGPDIARINVVKPLPEHPLEALTDLENNAKIGDDVVVLGNSGGGGVVTSLGGKIVGIGPDRIEVSAEFIPGNSGSPIIHVATGKVIGIATYLTRRYEEFTPDKGNGASGANGQTGTVVVRRFGYRIDKVPAWEPVNWNELSQEADQMQQISKLTKDVLNFMGSLRDQRAPIYATETLRRPAEEWLDKLRSTRINKLDRVAATESFLNAMRFIVHGDVAVAERQFRYTYFRNELKEEKQVRDRLYKAFDDNLATLSTPFGAAFH